MNVIVDATDTFRLLRETWARGWHGTVEFHNRVLRMPAECVDVVTWLQRSRRSYLPQRALPLASTSYDVNGRIRYMTFLCRDLVHDQWKRVFESVAHVRAHTSARAFARGLTQAVIGDREHQKIYTYSLAFSRGVSVPRLRDDLEHRNLRQRKSRSLSALDPGRFF